MENPQIENDIQDVQQDPTIASEPTPEIPAEPTLEEVQEQYANEVIGRCAPLAIEVNKILTEENVELNGVDLRKSEAYKRAKQRILDLFTEKGVLYSEANYIFDLASQPVTFMRNMIQATLEQSFHDYSAFKFGLKSDLDLSCQMILAGLKEAVEAKVGKKE